MAAVVVVVLLSATPPPPLGATVLANGERGEVGDAADAGRLPRRMLDKAAGVKTIGGCILWETACALLEDEEDECGRKALSAVPPPPIANGV